MIELVSSPVMFWLYLIGAVVLAFCATYTWWTWFQVGGMQGAMLAVMMSCLAVIAACFSILHAGNPRADPQIVLIVQRCMWPGVIVAGALLADAYAASKNDHRSFTSRSYYWYKRRAQGVGAHQRRANVARRERSEVRT